MQSCLGMTSIADLATLGQRIEEEGVNANPFDANLALMAAREIAQLRAVLLAESRAIPWERAATDLGVLVPKDDPSALMEAGLEIQKIRDVFVRRFR